MLDIQVDYTKYVQRDLYVSNNTNKHTVGTLLWFMTYRYLIPLLPNAILTMFNHRT